MAHRRLISLSLPKPELLHGPLFFAQLTATAAVLATFLIPVSAQDVAVEARATITARGAQFVTSAGRLDIEMMEGNILRIDVQPGGKKSPRTPVLDPNLSLPPVPNLDIHDESHATVIRSERLTLSISHIPPYTVTVHDGAGNLLVEEIDPFGDAHNRSVILHHKFGEALYGMRGLDRRDNGGGMLRNNGGQSCCRSSGRRRSAMVLHSALWSFD